MVLSTKIVKLGNSQGVRLPKSLLKEIGIVNPINTPVQVSVANGKIVISPQAETSRLMQRFAGFDLDDYFDNSHQVEDDWGDPVGKERL
jgi:antitoxin MazE